MCGAAADLLALDEDVRHHAARQQPEVVAQPERAPGHRGARQPGQPHVRFLRAVELPFQ